MDWGHDVLLDPLVPANGVASPRDAPGAGLEWNDRELEKHVVQA